MLWLVRPSLPPERCLLHEKHRHVWIHDRVYDTARTICVHTHHSHVLTVVVCGCVYILSFLQTDTASAYFPLAPVPFKY